LYGTLFRLSRDIMSKKTRIPTKQQEERSSSVGRPVRADALRNIDILLKSAKAVFAVSGVDAPIREIAQKAGVGVGTFYRHFPQRSDLIAAVFSHEIDQCADTAVDLLKKNEPSEALSQWMQRYAALIATKRGLATALHSGDPAFEGLPAYFETRLVPALRSLLEAASAAGKVRGDVEPNELLTAVARLCVGVHPVKPGHTERMVALLIDGLRYGARPLTSKIR
jgi:AcrR family transcriptional regulator